MMKPRCQRMKGSEPASSSGPSGRCSSHRLADSAEGQDCAGWWLRHLRAPQPGAPREARIPAHTSPISPASAAVRDDGRPLRKVRDSLSLRRLSVITKMTVMFRTQNRNENALMALPRFASCFLSGLAGGLIYLPFTKFANLLAADPIA